ncbi:MAG: Xaa-Pro peptidase family protein [Ignavibacteriales bacterium]|jgi:Xaa-Pro aminopeptidase|nr:MAG: aminopeptidase P family protein [Ignavibacteriaceae bacterium]MBW7873267.1 aminopeptidase P family protein [Ignavibacteria bacterium]MCZ2143005.1 Xaa-Pro peptidase family protein [Ignavibacteriales bacterium]OQY74524.1 MAG: Xaa-Pro aminopeptidase [Ignavibacteriales bacterium UTCHB3]MBV6444694.1 putative peptidase [Ignavibacteriaceae bacterium]
MNEIILQKQKQAIEILKEQNIDMWLTFVRESASIHDPVLDTIAGVNVTWQSAFILTASGERKAILGSLDIANLKDAGTFDDITGYVQSIREPLREFVQKHDPKTIAVNFSKNMNLADGLTYGLYQILLDHFNGTPYGERLVSSENIVSALRGRKSPDELKIMREAVIITLEIFDEVGKFITKGKTEKEIAQFMTERTQARGLTVAWEADSCPAVFTGPDTAGAHAGPTDRKVEGGHLINIDFGVNYKGYCSDLQRTWYILKDDETDAPAEVKRGFEVLKTSITKAAEALKPGIKGVYVDAAARGHITANGFDEYPHGLGHQVGRVAHDAGPGLFPAWEKYGDLPFIPLEKDQVFTIEPRLFVPGHGIVTIEEEVVLTDTGIDWLSQRQEELMLLR